MDSSIPFMNIDSLGSSVPIEILWINSAEDIWIRPELMQRNYQNLLKVLYGYYVELEQGKRLKQEDVVKGRAVCVHNFGVHRAIVSDFVDEEEREEVEVWYVDSGCRATVNWRELIELEDVFRRIPRMAVHCGLVDVHVKESLWSDTGKYLRGVTFGKNGVLEIVDRIGDNGSVLGRISIDGDDIGELLVGEEYAKGRRDVSARPGQ